MKSPSGNLRRCLALSHSVLAAEFANRQLVAEFTGVSTGTVRRWLKNSHIPIGHSFWSACLFFDLIGYRVTEYSGLPDLYKSAIKVFTYGADSPDSVATYFGHDGINTASLLYRRFRENTALTEAVEQQAASILNSEVLVELITEIETSWIDRLESFRVSTEVDQIPVVKDPTVSSEPNVRTRPKAKVKKAEMAQFELLAQTFAGLVATMQPLARYLESDQFSATERDIVRETAGQKNLFELSNVLSRLCSERARAIGGGGDGS